RCHSSIPGPHHRGHLPRPLPPRRQPLRHGPPPLHLRRARSTRARTFTSAHIRTSTHQSECSAEAQVSRGAGILPALSQIRTGPQAEQHDSTSQI
ncbi:hypothetical protein OC842_007975, partial [Tilletia horrida]